MNVTIAVIVSVMMNVSTNVITATAPVDNSSEINHIHNSDYTIIHTLASSA